MKITILQRDILRSDTELNLKRIDEVINRLSPTDLIVLPEMFSTGFVTEPKGIVERDNGNTLRWMIDRADALDCAMAGSIAVKSDERYANRFFFVKPGGDVTFCDKHHLFAYGGERTHFIEGNEKTIVEWRGLRIRLLVCYDLRFPVWSRNIVKDKNSAPPLYYILNQVLPSTELTYDIALYVANWPASRIDAWDILLKARAIENQCYVVGVNRVGRDQACTYGGNSAIIDAYGHVMASCGRDVEAEAEADIDIEALNDFRKKFPALRDADCFTTEK